MKYEKICEDLSTCMSNYNRSQTAIDMSLKYIETAETEVEAVKRMCKLINFCDDFEDEDEVQFTKRLKEFIGLTG